MSSAQLKDYTVKDLIQEFNASRETVMKLLKTGKLRGYLLNGRWRVEPYEVQDYKRRNIPALSVLSEKVIHFPHDFPPLNYKPGDVLIARSSPRQGKGGDLRLTQANTTRP